MAFAGGDRTIVEAYRRGAWFCFGATFDLIQFKDRAYQLCSFRRGTRSQRVSLIPPEDPSGDGPVQAVVLPDGILKAVTYIEDHLSDRELTLQRMAQAACMSTFHFHRAFKKHTSHSPMHFLAIKRVDRAKNTLRHAKRLSISEIATVAGFHDASSLSENFRRLTGSTPTQYRRSAAAPEDAANRPDVPSSAIPQS